MAPDLAILTAPHSDVLRLDDEAFCRLALCDELPPLGLSFEELLRRARPEKAAA